MQRTLVELATAMLCFQNYSMLSCLIGVAFPHEDNSAHTHSPSQILCKDDIYA
jgi:hypothetical protein